MIKTGSMEVSGNTSLSFSDTKLDPDKGSAIKSKTTVFNVDGLYYLMDNLGVGALIQYVNNDVQGPGDNSSTLIGPVVKFHIPIENNLNAFLRGSIDYISMDVGTDSGTGWGGLVGAGLAYFPNDWASVNCGVDYTYGKVDFSPPKITATDLSVAVGFSVYFK